MNFLEKKLKNVQKRDHNMSDLISRRAAINETKKLFSMGECYCDKFSIVGMLNSLPPAQPEIVRCKDCKYFELDHFEKVGDFPIPIIVAHEICMKWSNGCKTSKDGWCFMGERRTDERFNQ